MSTVERLSSRELCRWAAPCVHRPFVVTSHATSSTTDSTLTAASRPGDITLESTQMEPKNTP